MVVTETEAGQVTTSIYQNQVILFSNKTFRFHKIKNKRKLYTGN